MSADQKGRSPSAVGTSILSSAGAIDIIHESSRRLIGRTAIMAKLAEGQASHEQLGVNREFDTHFWRGVELLERENLEDLQAMTAAAEALYDAQRGGR